MALEYDKLTDIKKDETFMQADILDPDKTSDKTSDISDPDDNLFLLSQVDFLTVTWLMLAKIRHINLTAAKVLSTFWLKWKMYRDLNPVIAEETKLRSVFPQVDVQVETEIRLTSMMTTVVGSLYLPFMWHLCPGCLSLQCVCVFRNNSWGWHHCGDC